ncbi:hypothetical protein J6590_006206 [Homalodisca vitripennis]|nr:hypothetical protein J6590_006206 [Homalodisca vitripennis]
MSSVYAERQGYRGREPMEYNIFVPSVESGQERTEVATATWRTGSKVKSLPAASVRPVREIDRHNMRCTWTLHARPTTSPQTPPSVVLDIGVAACVGTLTRESADTLLLLASALSQFTSWLHNTTTWTLLISHCVLTFSANAVTTLSLQSYSDLTIA